MSEKITFSELVAKISAQTEQSEQSTNDFIHELAGIIESSLGAGQKISISGFGKFELRWIDERKGRNPQTGEEITIPGQNKVVFKPYKALREKVNQPFENLESQVIGDEPTESQPSKTPVLPFTSASGRTTQMSQSPRGQTEEDLIIERERPVDQKMQPTSEKNRSKESGYKPSVATTEDDKNLAWVFDQKMKQQDKQVRDVQSGGNYKWSYTAAAIVVVLAIFLFVFLLNNQDESDPSESASLPNQSTIAQVDSNRENEVVDDPSDRADEQAQISQNGPDSVSATAEVTDNDSIASDVAETHTLAEGESLWTIAQNKYGDPYLWPLIYDANKGALTNPNLLPAENTLQLPTLTDPENLSEAERKMVALGYISVYDWISENQPDEARYYLWAAGSFSQEVLQDASENVNEADLAFATQG